MRMLAFLSLILWGCAVPATHHKIQTTWTSPYDSDVLWESVVAIYGVGNIPILTIEKDSKIIVSDWFMLSPEDGEDIDCGIPSVLSVSYEKQAKLTVLLRELIGQHIAIGKLIVLTGTQHLAH